MRFRNLLPSRVTLVVNAKHSCSSMNYFVVVFLVICLRSCKGQDDAGNSATVKVHGGTNVTKMRFPYICSLRGSLTGSHFCGGVLIDKDWVMTAAHCLDQNNDSYAEIKPFIACDIYEREDHNVSKSFATKTCFLHYLWNGNAFDGTDIALCELKKSANLPIPKLASIDQTFTDNDMFSVLGWGNTSDNSGLADVLQIGENLKYRNNSECNAVSTFSSPIKESMMCAGRGIVDTCEGDSGGPLFIPRDLNNASTEDIERNPGVYTRVSCYRSWIDCIVQGTDPDDCRMYTPCEGRSLDRPTGQGSSNSNEAEALEVVRKTFLSDDSTVVERYLLDGLDPNIVFGTRKHSLLIKAAQHDAVESAKVLIRHKAKIEYKNNRGLTALLKAVEFGRTRVTKFLIERGADIESKDNSGWTPLSYAAYYNYLQVARILLNNAANIESKTNDEQTALHLTAGLDSVEVAEELITRGANIEAKTNLRDTPLILAAFFGSSNIVQLLLNKSAIVDTHGEDGGTALYWAAARGHVSIVGILLDNGASKSSKENTPFEAICEDDRMEKPCSEDVITTLRILLQP